MTNLDLYGRGACDEYARRFEALRDPHSFFGPLTAAEWSTLMAKHLDHHLRQFGR